MNRQQHDALKSKIVDVLYFELEQALLSKLGITRKEAKRQLLQLGKEGKTKPKGPLGGLLLIYTDENRGSLDIVKLFDSVLGVVFEPNSGVTWRRAK